MNIVTAKNHRPLPPPDARCVRAAPHRVERGLLAAALATIVGLPLIEVAARPLAGIGIPGSIDLVRHLTLWIGFLGAVAAVPAGRHLSLGFAAALSGRWRGGAEAVAGGLTVAVCLLLAKAAFDMVLADRAAQTVIAGVLPLWLGEIIMPAGFAIMGWRFFLRLPGGVRIRATVVAIVLLAAALEAVPVEFRPWLLAPGFGLTVVAAAAGAPIFTVLGAAALLLFWGDATPIASIPVEAYRLAANPILPTVPLFTLAGAILAEGDASRRLMRAFRALFGWCPGGTAIVTIAVCAFFTTFSGGSGVTLLALGALMMPVLVRDGYSERFALGTITASGSLGILFPPSLLIILYGVASFTPIDRLFAAALAPGLLLMTLVCLYAVLRSRIDGAARHRFEAREAAAALGAAKWELMLPPAILIAIFSGVTTLVEAASLSVAYALFVEFVIHHELDVRRDLPRVLVACGVLIGGIMIILAAAMGLANYLVYADVPTAAAAWIESAVESRWLFLLGLNLFLLAAGCLLDIFSAIVVLVPLITPVAAAYGVDPLHLGVIFLANMELGYLTPPVGMNLFLAAFRFERPLMTVYRASLPFFLIILAGVLAITYVPWLSTALPGMIE
jgi:tripartite ATP-independent transporter DctM subunit